MTDNRWEYKKNLHIVVDLPIHKELQFAIPLLFLAADGTRNGCLSGTPICHASAPSWECWKQRSLVPQQLENIFEEDEKPKFRLRWTRSTKTTPPLSFFLPSWGTIYTTASLPFALSRLQPSKYTENLSQQIKKCWRLLISRPKRVAAQQITFLLRGKVDQSMSRVRLRCRVFGLVCEFCMSIIEGQHRPKNREIITSIDHASIWHTEYVRSCSPVLLGLILNYRKRFSVSRLWYSSCLFLSSGMLQCPPACLQCSVVP